MEHLKYLQTVADEDVRQLQEKERTYEGSWKARGGVGCFMMLARKWDRIENMLKKPLVCGGRTVPAWDIFGYVKEQCGWFRDAKGKPFLGYSYDIGKDGMLLAEVRDLRRYLLLVEAELMATGDVSKPSRIVGPAPADPQFQEDGDEWRRAPNKPGTPEDGGHHARHPFLSGGDGPEARHVPRTFFDDESGLEVNKSRPLNKGHAKEELL